MFYAGLVRHEFDLKLMNVYATYAVVNPKRRKGTYKNNWKNIIFKKYISGKINCYSFIERKMFM